MYLGNRTARRFMLEFRESLRSWRTARRFSQLELAMKADISARHLSFLETGRARPSRAMVARLGEALQLPLSARNEFLTLAGYAVRYQGRDWDADEMAPIRQAVDRLLEGQLPYPGLALDRLWRIRRANAAALALFGGFGLTVGDSLLDLMLSSALPALVENWPEVAHHAAQRLRTESLAQGGVRELDEAVTRLLEVPQPESASTGPVIPTVLRFGETRLSMFATVSQFGTPEDLLLEDLKIELYFPTDQVTADAFAAMAADGADAVPGR